MHEGYIKLFRKITEKGWYKDSEYVHLWIHLLMKANHRESEFLFNNKLLKLKSGQFVTGRNQLSKETGISASKVERILNLFEIEHQIEQHKTTKNRVITIVSWCEYQINEQHNGQQVNNKRTATGQQLDTNKNDKNDNNEKNKNDAVAFYLSQISENEREPEIEKYKIFVEYLKKINPTHIYKIRDQLTYSQFVELKKREAETKVSFKEKIDSLINTTTYSKNRVSIYLTILNWMNRDAKR